MIDLRRKRYILLFLFLFVFPAAAGAECFSTVWPQEKSDLPVDPDVTYGRLPNGFRYILKHNTEPQNRVAMSLNVQAGSLHEDDDQRGLAHYLEHMLFNGSTNFAPGELVEYFQSIGMSYGGDTNAHTGYDETVYDIILPVGSKEEIEKGLLVFSDYARGALLLESEVERERGVILAEKRSRDSAAYRAHIKEFGFSMEGTRVPERVIIGTLASLNNADRDIIKRYYDAWYRPDNMALIMVGDFDQEEIEPLIEKQFADLAAAGEKPACPDLGQLVEDDAVRYFYHFEQEMGSAEVAIETHWNDKERNDSRLLEKEELEKYLATKIVQHRLDALARKSDTPFTAANVYFGTFLRRFSYGEINAESDPAKWSQSLSAIENVLRQALQYGFSADEFLRVKRDLLSELEKEVLTANSRNSKELAADIIRSLNRNRVFQSPEQERDLLSPWLEKMTVADVEQAFRKTWSRKTRLVKVNGNSVIPGDDPLQEIRKTFEKSGKIEVAAYKGGEEIKFPYLTLNQMEGSDVVARENFPEIDSKRIVFANNVVLNLKKSDFEENEIQMVANFGTGKSGSPAPGLALLGDAVIGKSGTGRLNSDELERVMSGSSAKLEFHVGDLSFQWHGKSLSKDVELLFQLMQSLLADPAVDLDAYDVAMDRLEQYYQSLEADVRGAMVLHGDRFLAGGDPYFGVPPWNVFKNLTRKQLADWYLPAAMEGGLEISLVGDFDGGEIERLAQEYFSVLGDRKKNSVADRKVTFPDGGSLKLNVPSSIDKGMLLMAWKTDDFWDIKRTRGLHLLAEIFSDKLRKEVREKLGATYSPQVYNSSSRVYKGYGLMQALLIVDPARMDALPAAVLKIAGEMFKGVISEEELDRAKGPMLTSLKDMVRTNRYWINSVLSLSSRYPQQLHWPTTIISGFGEFSVADMKKLGEEYLNPERAATVKVLPE